MQNNRSRLAIIHLAKKQLGLDDEAYRAILSGAGVDSAKDITTDIQFNSVMSAFKNLGFKSTSWAGRKQVTVSGNPGMISKKQEYYIKGLWVLASRVKDEKSLKKIIKRIAKVDDISFLPRRAASAVILALRDICWKAGFNPDTAYDTQNGRGDVVDSEKISPISGHGTSPDLLSSGDGRNRIDQDRQELAACTGGSGRV